jgi:transketolase
MLKSLPSHGGIEVGWDGPTHQAIEDIAITPPMPNMRVVVPADAVAATALLRQVVTSPGPVYFRMGRNPVPIIYDSQQSFTLGKAIQLRQGPHLTLIAAGVMVSVALQIASKLACKGIQATVLDMHTIKPIDHEALLNAALKTSLLVTLEDHSIIGGLGSAVAEVISEIYPRKIIRIGVPDAFSESGDPQTLFQAFKMDAESITERIFRLFQNQ